VDTDDEDVGMDGNNTAPALPDEGQDGAIDGNKNTMTETADGDQVGGNNGSNNTEPMLQDDAQGGRQTAYRTFMSTDPNDYDFLWTELL
jgi:hypothetical protein